MNNRVLMPYQQSQASQDSLHHHSHRSLSQQHPGSSRSAIEVGDASTPRDPLHRTQSSHPSFREKKVVAAKLRSVFINFREREELMTACAKGDVDKVSHILQYTKPSIDPDMVRDSKMRTPMLVACAAGKSDIVKVLIRWGADVNNPIGDIIGNKPLDLAVVSNNFDTVLALLEAGANVYPSRRDVMADDSQPSRTQLRTRTPLDLAQSRLDMLIQQREQTMAAMETESSGPKPGDRERFIDHISQIIQVLKFFANKRRLAPSPSQASDDSAARELDLLTAKLSSVDLNAAGQPSSGATSADLEVMKGLRDVISRLKI